MRIDILPCSVKLYLISVAVLVPLRLKLSDLGLRKPSFEKVL